MKIIKEARLAVVLLLLSATAVFAQRGGFNSGKNFPLIGNNEKSAVFLATSIAYWAAEEAGEDPRKAAKNAKDSAKDGDEIPYLQYGRDLAKTLSTLTQAEQDVVWYGQ
jgi:hypothetical protein